MIDIQKMEQMHEFVTLLTSGIKKAELEARLRTVLESFREAVVQELVAGSGEPVAFRALRPDWEGLPIYFGGKPDRIGAIPLYTADQLAGAVARERERCAKVCDQRQLFGNTDERWSAKECAAAIRSGE